MAEPFVVQGAVVELFESLVDVIFCAKDTDHRYVAVNLAFVRRTGRRSRREVLGPCTDTGACSAERPAERSAEPSARQMSGSAGRVTPESHPAPSMRQPSASSERS